MRQQKTAKIIGFIITIIGVIGFFTPDKLLIFSLNQLHNIIHVLSGLAGLIVGYAKNDTYARGYNRGFGIIYLALAVLGLLGVNFLNALLNLNVPDHILHAILGILLIAVGFSKK